MILEGNIDGFLKGSIETIGKNPVINELNVSENGIYMPDPGVDGFAPVNVNVSGPLLDTLNVIENGTYTPPSNIDGFNEVVVNVPIPTFSTDELNAIANGEYTPPSGVDGFSKVIVNVPKTPLNKLTVTENGTYTAPTDTGYDEVNVNVPLPSNAYLLKEIEDVDIASFSDGSNLPMPKLKVGIEPQQDLHGYDAPWVGGAGKNKMPPLGNASNNGITMATDINGNTVFNGTVEDDIFEAYVDLPSALTGNYVLSINNSQAISGTYQNTFIALFNGSTRTHAVLMNEQNTKIVVTNGTITRFLIRFQIGVTVTNFKISVQLEQGTTATSFAPYSNICPISGWDEVNVSRTGKNLVESILVNTTINNNGEINVSGGSSTFDMNIAKIIKGETYTIQSDESQNVNQKFVGGFFYDMPQLGSISYNNSRLANTPATFTAPIDGYVAFRTSHNYAFAQIELGTTATTYEPYNGQTYTIQFKDRDNPITVYGGTLDVVSGELKVVPYYASYNGETLEGEWISDRDVYAVGTTPTIGAQVVNIGATPQVIQLTPTLIETLPGSNVITADTGSINNIEYFAK